MTLPCHCDNLDRPFASGFGIFCFGVGNFRSAAQGEAGKETLLPATQTRHTKNPRHFTAFLLFTWWSHNRWGAQRRASLNQELKRHLLSATGCLSGRLASWRWGWGRFSGCPCRSGSLGWPGQTAEAPAVREAAALPPCLNKVAFQIFQHTSSPGYRSKYEARYCWTRRLLWI